MKSLLSVSGAVVLFNDGRINIIFVHAHFHLERRRVLREFPPSEMVEIEHDAKADADGIRNFQYGKAGCHLRQKAGVNIQKQLADADIGVKRHNGKRSSDKRKNADENRLAPGKPRVFLMRVLVR